VQEPQRWDQSEKKPHEGFPETGIKALESKRWYKPLLEYVQHSEKKGGGAREGLKKSREVKMTIKMYNLLSPTDWGEKATSGK